MLTSANVIIYLRKSRSDDPSMSVDEVLAKHESILQEYAINNYGSPIPEEQIYREVCSGETIADRPVMLQVMRLIEARIYGGVLVVEPQRLSRGDLEDCGKIINAFRYTETLVVTPPKTYDLLDDYDRKFFEMELMRGNDYLEYTKKILFRGRMASSKQGNFIGSIAPYGYRKVVVRSGKDAYHTLEIEPTESEAVKIMYHLYLDESYGFKKIANRLDELGFKPRKVDHWSAATIKNILENPVYCGKIQFNRRSTKKKFVDGELVKTRPLVTDPEKVVYVDGKHPALIDEARFQETMERRGKNPCVRKSKELTNPFAGLGILWRLHIAASLGRTALSHLWHIAILAHITLWSATHIAVHILSVHRSAAHGTNASSGRDHHRIYRKDLVFCAVHSHSVSLSTGPCHILKMMYCKCHIWIKDSRTILAWHLRSLLPSDNSPVSACHKRYSALVGSHNG